MSERDTDVLHDNLARLLRQNDPRLHLPAADRARILANLTRTRGEVRARSRTVLVAAAVVVAAVGIAMLVWSTREGIPDASAAMRRADAARAAGDPGTALAEYLRVLDWNGPGGPTEADRFKATLESVKCEIATGRPTKALDRFETMFTRYPQSMGPPDGHKHTLSVLSTLVQEDSDFRNVVRLLELAELHHPDHGKEFGLLADTWSGSKPEWFSELEQLGYLGDG